eukprot:403369358
MQRKLYKAGTLPSNDYAFTGNAYVAKNVYSSFQQTIGISRGPVFVIIKGFYVKLDKVDSLEENEVGLSKFLRDCMQISKLDEFEVRAAPANILRDLNPINSIDLTLDVLYIDEKVQRDNTGASQIHEKLIDEAMKNLFDGKMINQGEHIPLSLDDGNYVLKFEVNRLEFLKEGNSHLTFGVIEKETNLNISLSAKARKQVKLQSDKIKEKQIFKQNFNFQELGIGGLDKEFQEIFRRAFNTRRYPQHVIDKYGMKHVRGMLLYGPPGTGKTLIARQIAKALDCNEPKIVHGPEIFDKYVGGSEQKIRDLFKDAEKDMKELGDESNLHIIIFDEIDAICRQRGSGGNSGTGVNETVVNQLLSKMDGVDSLNNILVIGMTNRKDMIDEAMLRPGRLEIHLEIGLPDEFGRRQIFDIHTKHMRENNLLSEDVDFEKLAKVTKNYTGAEIEAVCRSATSFALFKDLDLSIIGQSNAKDPKSQASGKKSQPKPQPQTTLQSILDKRVLMIDFMKALDEIKPAFGIDNTNLQNSLRGGFYSYGERFTDLYKTGLNFINEIRNSKNTPLLTVLLEGKNGCGKTALAAKFALESQFPFVKLISPENFVGYSELGKISAIVKIFEDAYKSPLSLIVLDDIERLIEFIHIGPRFSNAILQALLVLIKKKPPNPDRKLMIIGTTSMRSIMHEMEVVDCFNVCLNVPSIKSKQEIASIFSHFSATSQEINKIASYLCDEEKIHETGGIPMKNMVLSIELALQNCERGNIESEVFLESLRAVHHF